MVMLPLGPHPRAGQGQFGEVGKNKWPKGQSSSLESISFTFSIAAVAYTHCASVFASFLLDRN